MLEIGRMVEIHTFLRNQLEPKPFLACGLDPHIFQDTFYSILLHVSIHMKHELIQNPLKNFIKKLKL